MIGATGSVASCWQSRRNGEDSVCGLKHLFIGSEGTLGISMAAVLKLFPRPREQATAFGGLASQRTARDCTAKVVGKLISQWRRTGAMP